MEGYLPLFPLNIVVFPGEDVNLHIFESRYKQLIHDCVEKNQSFGIPIYLEQRMEYGTEVEIEKVAKKYDDGTMDITTNGIHVFKLASFENPMNNKMYAGGQVEFLDIDYDDDYSTRMKMIQLTRELLETIHMVEEVEIDEEITSFDIGHKIGLSQKQEYELIRIPQENKRQEYIINHLQKTIPVVQEVEKTKDKIKMNGHFRHFDPLDF